MKLQVENISFKYKKDYIFEDISLVPREGELLGILGPNGIGKSTLLKCINRILDVNSGSITIDGKNIRDYSIRELAKIISYVPQNTSSSFGTTVIDLVAMGRTPYIRGGLTSKDKLKVYEALKKMGIDSLAFKNTNEVSGGERQKALIARSLVQETSIILLDEPTSSLDLKSQLEVLSNLSSIVKASNMMGIMVIHDINLASMFCDRILLLKNKKIYRDGSSEQVLNPKTIYDIYGVNSSLIEYEGKSHILLKKP